MRLFAPALIAGTLILGAVAAVAAPQIAGAAGAAGARTMILPGQWEYSYRVGPIPAGSEDRCLKQADVEQFAKGICTRKYTCDYDTRVVQDGKVQLKGTWTDKKGRVAPVDAKGTYTPESFRLNVHMKTINGIPLAGVMEAKRVSATCTPE
ncbi:DUF3617 family protein [Caulobacter sp. UNC358MFTsu5.1]|uniref:DUF3617 domain-containing protein n=1 Tax=Caulobacter sp. UNC358MFTsu5.1 TaxID=1449049 RepID=UPI0004A73C58|nr:DUF3617 family protein [Caulobacter sp. UNC358MFTsu5.1]